MVDLQIVRSLIPSDFGKGIARISQKLMVKYKYEEDEIIEVIANKRTGVRVKSFQADFQHGEYQIMLDGLTRSSINATIDSTVRIDKTISQPAEKVVVIPLNALTLSQKTSYNFNSLKDTPIADLDVIAINATDVDKAIDLSTELAIKDVSNDPVIDFGTSILGELRFIVKETVPHGIVIITDDTEFVVEESLPKTLTYDPSMPTYDDIGGYWRVINRLHELIVIPLQNPELFRRLNIGFPRGVLITGASGIGKSLLARIVASESGVYMVNILPSQLISGQWGESEKRIRKFFREAINNAPSLMILDDLDVIAPIRNPMITPELSRRLTSEFLYQIDQIPRSTPVLLLATSNNPEQLDSGFKRPGRFDHQISLSPPDIVEREEILIVKTRGVPIDRSVDLKEIGERSRGYSGADLNILVKEAALASLRRLIPKLDNTKIIPLQVLSALTLTRDDFNEALKVINPSAMKEILNDVPDVSWDDIGGLSEVKQKITESVEWPLMHPEIYENMGVKPPSGVLLYGPPGTGKTLLAKAIANATSSNFISVKGPELNSKWFGETERAIREIFRKAREVSPSLIFFDEIDSMIRVRGSSSAEPWIDRMINQFLAEMDGIDKKGRVIIMGATNRPELLDPAILRPGRFDRLIYVPVPDKVARLEIFKVHTKNMSLADDVDLVALAGKTEYYVGADIENLCREAAIMTLRKSMDLTEINQDAFEIALKETYPTMNKKSNEYFASLANNLRGNISHKDIENRDYFS